MSDRIKMLIVRFFAFLLDFLLVFAPAYYLLNNFLGASTTISNLIAQLMLIIYFVICNDAFNGQSIGKRLSKIQVVHDSGFQGNLAFDSIREAVKLVYFLPVVGVVLTFFSVIVYLGTGCFLHDLVGKSYVRTKI